MNTNPSEIKALLSLLTDTDQVVSMEALSRLEDIGEEAIPIMEKYWAENPEDEAVLDTIQHLQFLNLKRRLTEWKELFSDNLLMGIWVVATYKYPELEYSSLKHKIDDFVNDVRHLYDPHAHAFDKIRHLNYYFFDVWNFKGDTTFFHHERNSYINQVLEQKAGNPISLCILYKLIAEELGLYLEGVNFPNLFLLMHKKMGANIYLNIFARGLVLTAKDLESYLVQLQVPVKPDFLESCDNLAIIKRVLRNLASSYHYDSKPEKVKAIKELLAILDETDSEHNFPTLDDDDE